MSIQQISFVIQGMFCAQCAVDIERALTRLDGIVAAAVNYATQRATVVYAPTRVLPRDLVNTIRRRGYQVPLVRVVRYADDLLYASSAQTIEKVLGRTEGVVFVSTDLAARSVTLELLPDRGRLGEQARRPEFDNALARLGLRAIPSPTPDAARKFVLRAIVITGLAFLVVASAGVHAGLFASAGLFHSPLVVMVLSGLVLFGVGWRFYAFAYDAGIQGEFDVSVLMALLASGAAMAGLPLAMLSPTSWFTDAGFVVATALTAGWFLARVIQLWGLVLGDRAMKKRDTTTAPQTPLGAISDGSRH